MRDTSTTKLLNDLIIIQSGFAFKSHNYVDKGHFLVRIGNVQDGYFSLDNPKYVKLDAQTSRFALREGDLLTSLTGNIGRVAVVEPTHLPAALNQRVARITLKSSEILDRGYLLYFLSSIYFKRSLSSLGHGVAQQNVSPAEIRNIKMPVPPLPEQKRIVAILDEAFEGIDTAVANTEKNLANARELFTQHRDSLFSGTNTGWVTTPLAECLQLITYGFTNPMPSTNSGPYMVTAKNVIGGTIDYSAARHTSWEAFENDISEKSRPKVGDLLLTKDGTLGRVAVVDKADLCVNQSVAVLRPNGVLDVAFMRDLLEADCYQRRMRSDAGGATIKHIYITRVDKMPVTYPLQLDQQKSVVSQLKRIASESNKLTAIYAKKVENLRDLKNSLLQKAFAGELTTQFVEAALEAAE